VRHGEVFGLLEPNGASKTRTVETTAQEPAELQAWLKRVYLKKLGEAKGAGGVGRAEFTFDLPPFLTAGSHSSSFAH
jgi:hypothetical protein